MIVYQEALPLSSAKRLLEWAQQGLCVLLVNGVTEMVRNEIYVTHQRAASKTPYFDGGEETLAQVITELAEQPNVRVLDDQAITKQTLEEMGICARSPFAEPNSKILSFTRDAGNMRYLYLYHYMYQDMQPFFSWLVWRERESRTELIAGKTA